MLKIKVIFVFNFDSLINVGQSQALELQRNLENVGGEKLKSQKSKVQKIQSVSIYQETSIIFDIGNCLCTNDSPLLGY